LAKNSPLAKKYPENYEAVTMYCVDGAGNMWSRVGELFTGLFPTEASVVIAGPDYNGIALVLQDKNMNLVELESK
jgi:hypothetical protein